MAGGEHSFGRPTRHGPVPSPPPPPRSDPAGDGRWLPVPGHPDPAVGRPGLRRLRSGGRRWTWALLAVPALLGAGIALEVGLDRAADELLATGVRGDGTVVAIKDYAGGSLTIEIGYVYAGSRRWIGFDETSGRRYAVGDHVTVITDPARPDRVRTVEEPNEPGGPVTVGGGLLIAGVALFPLAVLRRAAWARRLARARRTGWHPAVVTVVPDRRLGAGDHRSPDLEIQYRDGTAITARSAHAYGVAALADRPRRGAWVAGTGTKMSVLFPHRPGGNRVYLVPATAVTERHHRP